MLGTLKFLGTKQTVLYNALVFVFKIKKGLFQIVFMKSSDTIMKNTLTFNVMLRTFILTFENLQKG